jgi:hypothetical protein
MYDGLCQLGLPVVRVESRQADQAQKSLAMSMQRAPGGTGPMSERNRDAFATRAVHGGG